MKDKKTRKIFILSIIFIAIDQITKILAIQFKNLRLGFIKINCASNVGFAFGLNQNNFTNILLAIIVIGIICNFIHQQKEKIDNKIIFSLAMVIAGGIGNLIDRILRGAVVDFIDIGNFPIFNLADCFVVIGWIILVYNLLDYLKYDIKFMEVNVKNKTEVKKNCKKK